MQAYEIFAHELEIFRTEAESAIQFYYSFLAVHATTGKDKDVHRLLNTAALFWNTTLGALQTSTFIALGRIFDQKSRHNIDSLLRMGQSNLDIFSKDALAERKRHASETADEWLDEYLCDVYVPTAKDFRRIRRHVAKRRKIYEEKYRALRHQFFAHKQVDTEKDVHALFAKTNIRELQQLLVFLRRLHEALWQLFYNGIKPTLQPARYSVRRIMEQPSPEHRGRVLQEQLVQEVEEFLRNAANQARGGYGDVHKIIKMSTIGQRYL